jgi:hypothetical protein
MSMGHITDFTAFPFVASGTVAVVAIHVVVADAGVFTWKRGAFVNVCNMHRQLCEKLIKQYTATGELLMVPGTSNEGKKWRNLPWSHRSPS